MPNDYRLPLSGISTHKSINPYSLKIINPDETITTYDGSDEAIIDLSDSKHAEQADKVVLASKQYTDIIGTADTDVDCRFYFLQIRPNNWSAAWHIKLKLDVYVNNNLMSYGHYECVVAGERDKNPVYANFNTFYDDEHYPIYNTLLYPLTQTGYINGLKALFGIDLQQAWNGFTSGYERTINIELIEADNCECDFLENASKSSGIPQVTGTNYCPVYVMNANECGLQETGDKDAVLRVYRQTIGYDNDYPVLASRTADIGSPNVDDSYSLVYAAIADVNQPTINLATGLLKVPGGIIANLTGNADTATALKTSRTINGTAFNGTANIVTSYWGTARNFSIQDADSANTGSIVSVNGETAVVLKLPQTIKASLNGNADSATVLATPRTINGTAFNGSANITTILWGTTRDISISDADSTNTGLAVSVDGSTDITLKLPAIIKADLTGNADTATALTSSAGSATQPVYFSNGIPVATTYLLSSTVGAGAANRFAYYSDANTIGAYTASVGNAYTPIYFNGGVPTTVSVVQYTTWSILSDETGVTISKAAYTANTYVLSIVVTSGEQYLNDVISWTSAEGSITLSTVPTSGIVTGYILTAIGAAI